MLAKTNCGCCCRNSCTTSGKLFCAAMCIGFCPWSSVASMFAPRSKSNRHTSSWPADAAKCRGVCFLRVRMSITALWSWIRNLSKNNDVRTTVKNVRFLKFLNYETYLQRSAKPFIAAKCNAVQPTLDLLFMNALWVNRASQT